jgi:hypothetical protein
MSSRLERFSALVARAYDENDKKNLAALARYRAAAKPGLARLAELITGEARKKAA